MSTSSRVRVYMACSLDGFIAGPHDDLSFLSEPRPETDAPLGPSGALDFDTFMAQVGAMLMGRHTHDVIAGLGGWAYGDTPVLVATNREIEPASENVRVVRGDIASLIAHAKEVAGERDVYLDGGSIVRQALDAGLVDELCLTMVPTLLGEGIHLFGGLLGTSNLEFTEHHRMGPMLQVTARVIGPTAS
jgi:dihydrofolate reductase